MLTAVLYGLLACAGFFVGVLVGLVTRPPQRLVAAIMAFGGGVLVSALTFDLMEEASAEGSTTYVIVGFLAGALIYVLADLALERMARASPKRKGRDPGEVKAGAGRIAESPGQAAIGGTALLIGAVLDGIPENAAIGIGLGSEGSGLGLVLLAAVFLGNVPESISSTVGMRQEGRSAAYVIGVWGAVTVGCVLATVAGYALLGGLSANMVSAVLALVLVGTSASHGFREESLKVAQRRATPEMLASLGQLWDGSLENDAAFEQVWRKVFPLYFHRLPHADVDALARRSRYRLDARRRILPTLQHYDLRDRLSEIAVPVLVITGRHDWITSVRQAEELVAVLRRGQLVVFEDSGHYPFIEETDRFLAVVSAWLAQYVPDAGTRGLAAGFP